MKSLAVISARIDELSKRLETDSSLELREELDQAIFEYWEIKGEKNAH